MKIVQILASSGGVGGLEQHTFNLCNQLALTEEVHVITHPCYATHFNSAVHFHALNMQRSRWNLALLWQLRKVIMPFGLTKKPSFCMFFGMFTIWYTQKNIINWCN